LDTKNQNRKAAKQARAAFTAGVHHLGRVIRFKCTSDRRYDQE
jgi:hypothetical protein